jgi:hypothetical protein
MPVARPTAANPPDVGLSACLQPLAGCLLLALPMCIAIVLYTNHVKEASAMLSQLPLSRASAAETLGSNSALGPAALEKRALMAQSPKSDVSPSSRQSSLAGPPVNEKDALDHRIRFEPDKQAMGAKKRFARKVIRPPVAGSSTARLTFSRGWSRTNYPSHLKAGLIAVWHQSQKRGQDAKTPKRNQLAPNPSTKRLSFE